jgi:hypothetical protein
VPGAVAFAVHFDLVRALDRGTPAQDLDPCKAQHPLVHGVEAGDFLVLVPDQRAPVEARLADRPPEARGDLEILAEVGRVGEQLLGDAPYVDAGAAEVARLGDRDPRAIASADPAGANAAGAAAYREEVVVEAQLAENKFGNFTSGWGD